MLLEAYALEYGLETLFSPVTSSLIVFCGRKRRIKYKI